MIIVIEGILSPSQALETFFRTRFKASYLKWIFNDNFTDDIQSDILTARFNDEIKHSLAYEMEQNSSFVVLEHNYLHTLASSFVCSKAEAKRTWRWFSKSRHQLRIPNAYIYFNVDLNYNNPNLRDIDKANRLQQFYTFAFSKIDPNVPILNVIGENYFDNNFEEIDFFVRNILLKQQNRE
jgi:hypothetical protein